MIPEKFKERAKVLLLGEEYSAFIDALENAEAVRGVRINALKATDRYDASSSEYELIPLDYLSDGYILKSGDGIGNTPEHHAGIIYVQDPGAMSALGALDIERDWWIADLCAAPGGKSGQAAARLMHTGFLLSNEYVPKRAKITVGNFERLGIRNALVTSLDTEELAKMFSAVFDLVITDAPCSGEGMFRKSDESLSEWSVENVLACAQRQKGILNNAKALVKPGGYLLYCTCTYSIEENEGVIDDFLSKNPDFSLCEVKEALKMATRPGIAFEGSKSTALELCRRFYPHISPGEGQFVALLKRSDEAEVRPAILYKDTAKAPSKDELSAIYKFFDENLTKRPDGRIAKVGQNLVILSHGCPVPERSVFMSGVLCGSVEKGLFFPSHQFFSAYGELFKRQIDLSPGDDRLRKYLRGEEIDAPEISSGGWCTVTYSGSTIGGGKAVGAKIKNHYPKGLRLKG